MSVPLSMPISLSSLFRILMLAMLMTGVVMKPVLAFASDMHEDGHGAVASDDGHAHDHDHDAPDPVEVAVEVDPGDPSDAKDPWHALMHFGHCCGQTPALLEPMPLGPLVPAVSATLPPWPVVFEPAVHPVDLRPPITT